MKTVAAGEFKQTCLKLLDEVEETRETIVVTKRGKPVAQVVPLPRKRSRASWLGSLRGTAIIAGDVVAPAADPAEWETLRE